MIPSHDIAVERLDLEQSDDRLQVALHQQRYHFMLAHVSPEDSVLEVGTGRGFFSQMILGRCKQFAGLEYRCERLQGHTQPTPGTRGRAPRGRTGHAVCAGFLLHDRLPGGFGAPQRLSKGFG